MATRLDEKLTDVEFDNSIASVEVPIIKKGITVASGQGKLTKNTILAKNSAGKMVILGTTETVGEGNDATTVTCEANCILDEDVDATSADVIATAKLTGCFRKEHLTVKANYTFTEDNFEILREKGIFLL